jgi:6-phosphogluconolactonase
MAAFKVYDDDGSLLRAMTLDLLDLIWSGTGVFSLALSGGGTAQKMFALWCSEDFRTLFPWDRMRFFWADERCVPPDSPESNYGQAYRLLFKPLRIPLEHVFRIIGENDPALAAAEYAEEVRARIRDVDGSPRYDAVILGAGPDAHTASIFPGSDHILTDKRMYVVARHPSSGQYRVTMTGSFILSGAPIFMPVAGSGKSAVVAGLREGYSPVNKTPAAYIISKAAEASVYVLGQ